MKSIRNLLFGGLILLSMVFAGDEEGRFVTSVMFQNYTPVYYVGYSFGQLEILGGYNTNKSKGESSWSKHDLFEESTLYGVKYYLNNDEDSQLRLYIMGFIVDGSKNETEEYTSDKYVTELKFNGQLFGIGAQYFMDIEKNIAINCEFGYSTVNADGKVTNTDLGDPNKTETEDEEKSEASYTYAALGVSVYF